MINRRDSVKNIKVDEEIVLVKYYPNYKTSLKWYLDKDVCKQVDNINHVYDLNLLKNMYNYLNKNGYLYYVKYKGKLCGDVSLRYNGEIAIVIAKEYQNRHIGRRVIKKIIEIARLNDYKKINANIYSFNEQSKKMFSSVGFNKVDEENYIYSID